MCPIYGEFLNIFYTYEHFKIHTQLRVALKLFYKLKRHDLIFILSLIFFREINIDNSVLND